MGLQEPASAPDTIVHESIAPSTAGAVDVDQLKMQINEMYQQQIQQIRRENELMVQNLKEFHAQQIKQLEKERDQTLQQSRDTISTLNQKARSLEEELQQQKNAAHEQLKDIGAMKTLYEQKVAELELQVQNVTLSNADLRT